MMTKTQSGRRAQNGKPGRYRWVPWTVGILAGLVAGGGAVWASPPPNATVLTVQATDWYRAMRDMIQPATTSGTTLWTNDPQIYATPPLAAPPEPTGDDELVSDDIAELVNVNAPIPNTEQLGSALDAALADATLTHRLLVVDVATGQTLIDRGGEDNIVPASTLKLFTAVSVLHHLDPDHRFTTSATYDASIGVTLVGGGDGLLATTESTGKTVGYAGLADLANDTWKAIAEQAGGGVVDVRVDISRYTAPYVHPAWNDGLMESGWVSPVYPLNTWGGFVTNPAYELTAVEDGAAYAGTAFANRLTEAAAAAGADVQFTYAGRATGNTTADAEPVARVRSAPVSQQLEFAMKDSNNMLFEMLGREAAIAAGATPSFSGATNTTLASLQQLGIHHDVLNFVDNSGLSPRSRATLRATVDAYQLMVTNPKFRHLLDTLTIAGYDGTMRNRLTEAPYSGIIRSKTGTLEVASSNAGLTVTADGRALWFAINTTGADGDYAAARTEQDLLVATITDCGCNTP